MKRVTRITLTFSVLLTLPLSLASTKTHPRHACQGLQCSSDDDCGSYCWCITPNHKAPTHSNLGVCTAREDVQKPTYPKQ